MDNVFRFDEIPEELLFNVHFACDTRSNPSFAYLYEILRFVYGKGFSYKSLSYKISIPYASPAVFSLDTTSQSQVNTSLIKASNVSSVICLCSTV